MKIWTVRHKGLKRLIEEDDDRGLRSDQSRRIRNILAAIVAAPDMPEVEGPPGWRIHRLTGDRAGSWSIAVSGNWRITFAVENAEIWNLDLEDYH